jgi:hypothetical protein
MVSLDEANRSGRAWNSSIMYLKHFEYCLAMNPTLNVVFKLQLTACLLLYRRV